MKEQRMSWEEFSDYLTKHNQSKGVVVFKNGPYWEKEYPLEERSYLVSGDNKRFKPYLCGTSIFANNLAKTDMGVRLDWYMWGNGKDDWEVDYCYLVEE